MDERVKISEPWAPTLLRAKQFKIGLTEKQIFFFLILGF